MALKINEIYVGSVVFMDIIAYSVTPNEQQIAIKRKFNSIVAEALSDTSPDSRLSLDTGDGAAIGFLWNPEAALKFARHARKSFIESSLQVRIGVNLGPITVIKDINDHHNMVGDGINSAQRVMGFSASGQIFASQSFFENVKALSNDYPELFKKRENREDKHGRTHLLYEIVELSEQQQQSVLASQHITEGFRTLGRYKNMIEIGKGSVGVVYKALDANLDLVVALKVLKPELISDDDFVRRFLAEAKALAKLDHPNIVRVFNADRLNDQVFITMEFVDGKTLADNMGKIAQSIPEIINFGISMANALDYAHNKGIVHRDIKPGNILFTNEGRPKISDFGIAYIEDPHALENTKMGFIVGTPVYMSPEQVLGKPVDGRSDLFSLGIILYELATGVRPFSGQGMHAVFNEITSVTPQSVSSKNSSVPKQFSDVVMKCLCKEPSQRFGDGKLLAAALHEILNSKQPALSVKQPLSLWKKAAASVTILTAISVGGGYVYNQKLYSSRLSLESTPAGADVHIDGMLRGKTPLKARLKPGKHEVKIILPNYESWESQIELDKDSETTVPPVNLVSVQQ